MMEATVESDAEGASDPCSMCDTLVISTGQERRLEDWSLSSGHTVCAGRCSPPCETILHADAPCGVLDTPARTFFLPRCLIHEVARELRPAFQPRILLHQFTMRSSRLDDCAVGRPSFRKLAGMPCERTRTARTRIGRLDLYFQFFLEKPGEN